MIFGLLIVYFVLFMASLAGFFFLAKRKERPKQPFKKDTRLLRGPGESLLKKVNELDEQLVTDLVFAMGSPLLLGALVGFFLTRLKLTSTETTGWISILVTVTATLVVASRLIRKARKRANYQLGYFGERVVGEILETLKQQGWRIFHDIPAESGKEKFNVDHVAVGPGGVFAIETKCRRKGAARPGRKDYEVTYDGMDLSWPWKEDRYGIDQAIASASWLQTWLQKATGDSIRVMPVLTFPEWYVKELAVDPRLRIVASSWLPGVLTARSGVLTAQQIDLFARQLEQRCRDVIF